MSNTLANEAHQRSLKDFLTLYNTITEYCFGKCISNFNERNASITETMCVDVCTDNYVQFNQRFMFNFVDHQERRRKDQERLAIETAAKEAAAAQVSLTEQQNLSQDGQVQTTVQLDPLSLTSSSGVNSVSAITSIDSNTSQSSPLVETYKGDIAAQSDTIGSAQHVESIKS